MCKPDKALVALVDVVAVSPPPPSPPPPQPHTRLHPLTTQQKTGPLCADTVKGNEFKNMQRRSSPNPRRAARAAGGGNDLQHIMSQPGAYRVRPVPNNANATELASPWSRPPNVMQSTEAPHRPQLPFISGDIPEATIVDVTADEEPAAVIPSDIPPAPSPDRARPYAGVVRRIISCLTGNHQGRGRSSRPSSIDQTFAFATTTILTASARSGSDTDTDTDAEELGQTDIASLVAQVATILGTFRDGVAWVTVGSGPDALPPTPLVYRDLLLTICYHLALSAWPSGEDENIDNQMDGSVRRALEGFAFGSVANDEEGAAADFRRLKALFAPHIVNRRVLM